MEVVDETEMRILSKFFEMDSVPIGFYFGETDSGFKELIYFPGLCEECQKREVFCRVKRPDRRTGCTSGS